MRMSLPYTGIGKASALNPMSDIFFRTLSRISNFTFASPFCDHFTRIPMFCVPSTSSLSLGVSNLTTILMMWPCDHELLSHLGRGIIYFVLSIPERRVVWYCKGASRFQVIIRSALPGSVKHGECVSYSVFSIHIRSTYFLHARSLS